MSIPEHVDIRSPNPPVIENTTNGCECSIEIGRSGRLNVEMKPDQSAEQNLLKRNPTGNPVHDHGPDCGAGEQRFGAIR
ncbi:MAG: hypothetical protein OXH76_15485 [Boseongicola sp.]|nr:hypothetical protein [Boseongicola sp.]